MKVLCTVYLIDRSRKSLESHQTFVARRSVVIFNRQPNYDEAMIP